MGRKFYNMTSIAAELAVKYGDRPSYKERRVYCPTCKSIERPKWVKTIDDSRPVMVCRNCESKIQ